jgi:hypothetical protein
MATTEKTPAAEQPETVTNLRFDNPWKAKFRLDKIKTAVTDSVADGVEPGTKFYYPLLTLTVLNAGTAKVIVGKQYLLHGHPTSLLEELKRIKPAPGSVLDIDYQGRKKSKSGYEPHIFECDSPTAAAFDWDGPNF